MASEAAARRVGAPEEARGAGRAESGYGAVERVLAEAYKEGLGHLLYSVMRAFWRGGVEEEVKAFAAYLDALRKVVARLRERGAEGFHEAQMLLSSWSAVARTCGSLARSREAALLDTAVCRPLLAAIDREFKQLADRDLKALAAVVYALGKYKLGAWWSPVQKAVVDMAEGGQRYTPEQVMAALKGEAAPSPEDYARAVSRAIRRLASLAPAAEDQRVEVYATVFGVMVEFQRYGRRVAARLSIMGSGKAAAAVRAPSWEAAEALERVLKASRDLVSAVARSDAIVRFTAEEEKLTPNAFAAAVFIAASEAANSRPDEAIRSRASLWEALEDALAYEGVSAALAAAGSPAEHEERSVIERFAREGLMEQLWPQEEG